MAFGFKLGGSTPVDKLLGGKLKDEEKAPLLAALASVPPLQLVPLLCHDDPATMSRAAQLFLPRADAAAVLALLEDLLARPMGAALGLKVLFRCREDLVQVAFDAALGHVEPEQARKLWEFALDAPGALAEAYQLRALKAAPPGPKLAALKRLLRTRGAEGLREPLLALTASRDLAVRKEALQALAPLEGEDVYSAMLERLGADDSSELRNLAARYLKQYLAHAAPEVRPRILARLLLAGDEETRSQLVQSMFGHGQGDDLVLGVLQFCRTLTGRQHRTVMQALSKVGAPLLPVAIAQLRHPDPDVRVQAVHLVEALADARAAAPLKLLLADPDWWVRIVVCEALGRLGSPSLIPVLQAAFADPDARWAAIEAVGHIGGEPAASALLPLLKDPAPEVRSAAVETLPQVRDPRVLRALTEVSQKDASLDVRLKAVEVLRVLQGDHRQGGSLLTSKELTRPLDRMLAYAREREASDLLITPGEPPVLRVNGLLERVATPRLEPEITAMLLQEVLDPVRRPLLEANGSVEFCHHLPGVGRFRTNIYQMRRGLAGAFRSIPNHAPSFDDLGLPRQLAALTSFHQGMVLVSGPAGCGKSTTLTSMVDLLNRTRADHILTFEEPVEFVHTPRKALINQREIGRDTASYASAMRAGLREDPDVVVVGDLRDPETIRLALLAAETGHLVIATLQTTGAAATVDKLVDAFPAEEQVQVRGALAASLKLVVSQVLVPRADGRGRVAVFEVLRSTSSVRALIREGKTVQLPSAMVLGRASGMQTLEGGLAERVRAGTITAAAALQFAPSAELLQRAMEAETAAQAAAPAPAVRNEPQAGGAGRGAPFTSSASSVRPAPGAAAAQGPAPFASSGSAIRTAPPAAAAPFASSGSTVRAPPPAATAPFASSGSAIRAAPATSPTPAPPSSTGSGVRAGEPPGAPPPPARKGTP